MEYILGALTSFIFMLYWHKKIGGKKSRKLFTKVKYTQSHYYSLISFAANTIVALEPVQIKTQSTNHFDGLHTRVFVVENQAYWISNNTVYKADFSQGYVDKESTSEVDIITMDGVELKKMIFIIEKLTEGQNKNERGNTGDAKL